MRAWTALILALGLASCGKSIPIVEIHEVKIPIAVDCVPKDLPARPVLEDEPGALLAAQNAAGRARLLEKGYGPRRARLNLLEDVVSSCQTGRP